MITRCGVMACVLGLGVLAAGQDLTAVDTPLRLEFNGPLVDLTVACDQIPPPLKARAVGGCRIPALADDLVLYYPFDQDLGGIVLDASGNGRTGQVHGATWVPRGPRGGAYRFDNNSQSLTATDAGLPAGDESRTLAVWIKLDRLEPDGTTGLFAYGTWQWNQACGLGLDWRHDRDRFYFTQNGGVALSARRVEPGVWQHLAYVYEGDGRHRLYVNGLPSDGMSELQGPLDTMLSGQLMLAGHPGSIGPNGGYLDEAMIFGRALTPAEVRAVYRGALPVEVVETAEADCPRVITRIWMMKEALAHGHDHPPIPVEFSESSAGDCPLVITRVWTATDRCGNTVSATQTITVVDALPPVLLGVPPSLTLECSAPIPPPPVVTARDPDACEPGPVRGAVLYYPFERHHGRLSRHNLVFDASGSGNHGRLAGARIGPGGIWGLAAAFDGVDDYIRVPSSPTLMPEAVTVAAWVKVRALPAQIAVLVHKRNTSLHNNEDYVLQLTSAGAARFVLANSGWQTRLDSPPLAAGRWHHVAATFSRPEMKIYVDGKLAGSARHDFPLAHNPEADLFLGASDHLVNPLASFADCRLDEVKIFPRALSPREVGALMRGAIPVEMTETVEGGCPGVITRVWTATDYCGNTASATQTITRLPASAPVLVGVPDDIELACGAAVPPPPLVTAVFTPGCEVSPIPGLVLHYPFDEDSGGTVLDASGGGRTGTVDGATWVPDGARGGAYRFDSNLQCMTATDAGLPSGDMPRTIAAWIRVDAGLSDATSTGLIFYGKRYSYNQETGVGVDGRLDRDRFFFSQGGACFLSQSRVGDPGQWVHVAYTYGGQGRHHFYVDGEVSDGLNELHGPLDTVLDGVLRVGGQPWDSGLAGISVDEVMIFNRELPADEVAALHRGPASVQMTESVAGDCPEIITRVWTATDGCGNTASATQTITVVDTTSPVLTDVPDNIELKCGEEIPLPPEVTAADACSAGEIPVTMAETREGDCPGVITRVWTATDRCGNTASATQTITIAAPPPGGPDWYVAVDGDDSAAGTSWDTAKRTIQAGIDAAAIGDTVWVSNGIYSGAGNRDISYRGKAIMVRSLHGPADTILDCQKEGRGFTFNSGETPEAVLSGFTIRNGHAVNGGGIFCSARPTIENCVILSNQVLTTTGAPFHRSGAGIYVEGSSANPTLRNCRILYNDADRIAPVPGVTANGGGIAVMSGAAAWIESCEITGNRVMYGGGGIYIEGTGVTVVNCIIRGNESAYWGGGVHCQDNSPTEVSRLINCLITGNTSLGVGGGIATYSGLVAENCTFHGNYGWRGGGIYSWPGARPRFLNTIVWGNTAGWAGPQFVGDDSPEIFSHCCSETAAPWPGTGNLIDNPLFLDDAAGDFRLQAESPCVDAGHNDFASGATDLAGNPRVVNGTVDMGVYELQELDARMTVQSQSSGTLSYRSSPDSLYTLQRCEDLTSGEWMNVPGQIRIRGSGGIDTLADPQPRLASFYRVIVEQP